MSSDAAAPLSAGSDSSGDDHGPTPGISSSEWCRAEEPALPRVAITFCTQCKWLLRAAYYAQELLSTFSTSLGEVALLPSIGGTFHIEVLYADRKYKIPGAEFTVQRVRVWDRADDGGFPETKVLKRRVRDVIEPGRGLGHIDREAAPEEEVKEGGEARAHGKGDGLKHFRVRDV
ncbi:MAG: hypothetical protein M1832_004491 [Thelocarpon impressellum]|nr:MAG: hypothetical protein M1832_004491 [Thelocarpon impressellum]